jgi:hypothetical protein
MAALQDALGIVDRLTRETLDLAGRVGFLQGQLESARERIVLLEAPKPGAREYPHRRERPGERLSAPVVEVLVAR